MTSASSFQTSINPAQEKYIAHYEEYEKVLEAIIAKLVEWGTRHVQLIKIEEMLPAPNVDRNEFARTKKELNDEYKVKLAEYITFREKQAEILAKIPDIINLYNAAINQCLPSYYFGGWGAKIPCPEKLVTRQQEKAKFEKIQTTMTNTYFPPYSGPLRNLSLALEILPILADDATAFNTKVQIPWWAPRVKAARLEHEQAQAQEKEAKLNQSLEVRLEN
jgi:hypothetical protein